MISTISSNKLATLFWGRQTLPSNSSSNFLDNLWSWIFVSCSLDLCCLYLRRSIAECTSSWSKFLKWGENDLLSLDTFVRMLVGTLTLCGGLHGRFSVFFDVSNCFDGKRSKAVLILGILDGKKILAGIFSSNEKNIH